MIEPKQRQVLRVLDACLQDLADAHARDESLVPESVLRAFWPQLPWLSATMSIRQAIDIVFAEQESILRAAGALSGDYGDGRTPVRPGPVVSVPALTDPELDEVAGSIPKLARPLGHPPLRKILRNPFLLDQAMNMPWPADRPMPDNEREFRSYFWRNTVRVDRGQPGASDHAPALFLLEHSPARRKSQS